MSILYKLLEWLVGSPAALPETSELSILAKPSLGKEQTLKSKDFSFRLNDDYDYTAQFVSLPSEVWEKTLKPREKDIAQRQRETKTKLSALREERKQAKNIWNAYKENNTWRRLNSIQKKEWSERKKIHDNRIKEIRLNERLLVEKLKAIKFQWRTHYDDIRYRRAAIINSIMEATENALQHETHWYFFLFPGERVKTVSDCRFLDRLQKGLGEVQVRVGSTGVVTQVESLKKGRYTFGIWFGAGKNNESYAEYDPEIHGAVIESHPNHGDLHLFWTLMMKFHLRNVGRIARF